MHGHALDIAALHHHDDVDHRRSDAEHAHASSFRCRRPTAGQPLACPLAVAHYSKIDSLSRLRARRGRWLSRPKWVMWTMEIDGACHCGLITYAAEVDPDSVEIC